MKPNIKLATKTSALALLVISLFLPHPVIATILTFEGFESGSIPSASPWAPWTSLPNMNATIAPPTGWQVIPARGVAVTSPVKAGTRAARFTTISTDRGYIYNSPNDPALRAQIARLSTGSPGVERWYAMSIRLDPTWLDRSNDPNGTVLAGLGTTNPDPGEAAKSGAFHIMVTQNMRWEVQNRSDHNVITTPSTLSKREWDIGPAQTGVWVDWVVRARWNYGPGSPGASGILQVWKDGIMVVNYAGPNCFNDQESHQSKFGVYKAWWGVSGGLPQPAGTVDTLTAYFDEMRIGDGNESYATMAPQGGGSPEVNVTGNGVTIADGDTTPSTIDGTAFGSADIATGTVQRTFTIQNTGTAALTLTSVTTTNTEFGILTQPSLNIAAGGSSNVTVAFNPSNLNLRTATISFTNNDSNESPYNFSVNGTGTSSGTTTATFITIAAEDAAVRESTETSGVGNELVAHSNADVWVGDSVGNRQYRGIVSFDTSGIPDGATITSATLRLKRYSVVGANPFTWGGQCQVDIRNGGFNGNVALETSDFQATASATNVAQMTSPASNGSWSTGVINSSGRAQINKTGKSQFRIRFATDDNNNNTADYIRFSSGWAVEGSRAELIVEYQ